MTTNTSPTQLAATLVLLGYDLTVVAEIVAEIVAAAAAVTVPVSSS